MGRKSNPVILAYFERGPKLKDHSNRYPHRCKACGEDFAKGRHESLVAHLTKKCPAISEAERLNACLSLHGMNGSQARRTHTAAVLQSQESTLPNPSENSLAQTNWTALETLAEVSRQIDLSEKHDEYIPATNGENALHDASQASFHQQLLAFAPQPFELHEQFTLENPPASYDNQPQHGHELQHNPERTPDHELSTEERLRNLLEADTHPMESNLTVAAAATARLNPALVSPSMHQQLDLLHDDNSQQPLDTSTSAAEDQGIPTSFDDMEQIAAIAAATVDQSIESNTDPALGTSITSGVGLGSIDATAPAHEMVVDYQVNGQPSTPISSAPAMTAAVTHESISPWGEMTYMAENIQPPATVSDQSQQLAYTLSKGGIRMDTLSPNGTRQGPTRARFNPSRRKEVQEVRRIGACIRCRILRKVCSKGTPCDTCRKVLSPRVWHTGCTRTRLAEQIELYSAGVQVVVAQKRVNKIKADFRPVNTGVIVEAFHFHDAGHSLVLQVLQGFPVDGQDSAVDCDPSIGVTVMIDNEQEDIPAQVENYMRRMLPEFIGRERSPHVRATLECAQKVAEETSDELLRRSLDLWGLTEIMDRERQWTFLKKLTKNDSEGNLIKDDVSNEGYVNETFTTFCTQLTAAAERKAALTSKNLLNAIQRNLQDGKLKLGFPMFLTAMVFLNCVEKMTWSFKAWEGEALQSLWPLERQPDSYYNQGRDICDLLKMLLHIRHIMPKVSASDPEQPIEADEEDETIKKYYEDLNVTPSFLRSREQLSFDPSESRSLEFLFCSSLLQP